MKAGPDYIQFYPTLRCNRSCGFCFNKPLPQLPDMELDSFRRVLDRLPNTITTIDIMGGEPTLNTYLVQMTEEIARRSLKVNISSNGSNVMVLEEIMDRIPSAVVGLSVNDRETLRVLEGFIRERAPVVKTVYSLPFDQQLVSDILCLEPRAFYLIYRDATDSSDLLGTSPFPDFLKLTAAMHASMPIGTVFCPGFLPDSRTYPELASVRCPAGTTKLGILPDGSVYPCNLFFSRPDYKLGNVLSDSFDAIWRHPALEFFRKPQSNACGRTGCTLHAECHGGCPAQALLLTGDLAAPDPRCSLRP